MLGVWRDADEKGSKNYFVATRGENREYKILETDGGGTAVFTARLVQLGAARFVDLFPAEPLAPNGFYGGHLVRVHSLGRIWLKGDRLRLGLLHPDWLKCDQGKASGVRWNNLGEDLLLVLEPTASLRSFALKNADTEAFSVTTEWVRERLTGT